ncbi:unnamed protein product [Cuscuta campestris]|uniref:Uncharacterized protein n=1 Tax=Cuscuta campestris TaxID=132261 RepID=A0A484N0U8_9ASTE|nr:unnamed protein product [Cuscuta campestris]
MEMMRSRMGFCKDGQNKKRPRFCPVAAQDYSDPFDLCNLQEGLLNLEKFGSVAKDIEELIARRRLFLEKYCLSAASKAYQKPHVVILDSDSDSHSDGGDDDANEKSDQGLYAAANQKP